jgi:hypothetical protein
MQLMAKKIDVSGNPTDPKLSRRPKRFYDATNRKNFWQFTWFRQDAQKAIH